MIFMPEVLNMFKSNNNDNNYKQHVKLLLCSKLSYTIFRFLLKLACLPRIDSIVCYFSRTHLPYEY